MIGRVMIAVLCGFWLGCDSSDNDNDNGDGNNNTGGNQDTASSGPVTCTANASHDVSTEPGIKTLTATGTITCTGPAFLELEVCVELDGADVICQTVSESGATSLTQTSQVGCFGTKELRAHVRASVDGTTTDHYSKLETLTCR